MNSDKAGNRFELLAIGLLAFLALTACDNSADKSTTVTIDESKIGTDIIAKADTTAVRPAENKGVPDQYGHWIGRNLMTSSSVELVWSEIPGDSVIFRVYRFERIAGFKPDTATLNTDTEVYSGGNISWTDTTVKPDLFYTYILEAEVDGKTLPRRWTEALTKDDTEAPIAITGLRAELTANGVLLFWNRSSDNVEFASYSVSVVEDKRLKYIGGGADLEQTSFLDNRPQSGLVTYAVVAVDFHNNRTEAATITVDIPE